MYVANNVVKNAYLDGAAMLLSGNTVPVQNSAGLNIQPGTVTVTSNAVTSVKLPANYTAFGDGIAHKVTDAAGHTAQATAAVSNGSLTDQTLAATASLILNGSSVTISGKVYTFTVAAGAITAIAVTDAPAS